MAIDGVWIPILAISCAPIIAIGVPIARAYARRLESKPAAAIPNDVTVRLDRMEQAIDSIAIEVERISEGQRFTTRLLTERSGGEREAPPATRPAAG
jgi:hypothetical protein